MEVLTKMGTTDQGIIAQIQMGTAGTTGLPKGTEILSLDKKDHGRGQGEALEATLGISASRSEAA